MPCSALREKETSCSVTMTALRCGYISLCAILTAGLLHMWNYYAMLSLSWLVGVSKCKREEH